MKYMHTDTIKYAKKSINKRFSHSAPCVAMCMFIHAHFNIVTKVYVYLCVCE